MAGLFGLLGVLATVALMGLLAVKVLDGTDSGLPEAVTSAAADGSATSVTSPSPAEMESSACAADRRTIETAIQIFTVSNAGTLLNGVDDLAAAGLIDGPVATFELVPGTTDLVGVGPCAGL